MEQPRLTDPPRLSAPIDLPEMLAVFDSEMEALGRFYTRQVEAGRMSGRTRERRLAVWQRIRERLAEQELNADFIDDCLSWRSDIADCLKVLKGWYPNGKQPQQGEGA